MKNPLYLDPRREPNKWLKAVLLDCVEDSSSEESKAMLRFGITTLIDYIDPGLIDQAFAPWIEGYLSVLAEEKSKQSNCHPEYVAKDPWE